LLYLRIRFCVGLFFNFTVSLEDVSFVISTGIFFVSNVLSKSCNYTILDCSLQKFEI